MLTGGAFKQLVVPDKKKQVARKAKHKTEIDE